MNLKRVISLLLVLILALGVMPAVSAADLSNTGYARGVAGVYADGCEAGTSPAYIFDGNLNTRWGSGSTTVWMKTDADVSYDHVNMAFLAGNTRRYSFKLDVCGADGVWETIFDGTSVGGTTGFERFEFGKAVSGEWLRFTGKGNSDNYWNNISEMTGVPLEEGPANLYLVDDEMASGVDEVTVAGETYLPFVTVAKACGMDIVSWDESSKTIKLKHELLGRRFEGTVGNNTYYTQEGTFATEKPLLWQDGVLLCHTDVLVDFISRYPSARSGAYKVIDFKKQIATQTDLAALAEMEKMFDPEKLLDLYVSLYDPETGGMYYSQPSVGREGFGPHIESTGQSELPISLMNAEEKHKVGSWIQSLQDPETGWFVEPEFDIKTVNVGKKQRDLNTSLGILRAAGMAPLYPTATERIPKDDKQEVVLMASGDVSTSDDSYLASLDNYMEWVRTEFDWDGTGQGRHVWHAGNDIGDFASQLRDLGWLDTVSEFIRSKQRPHNGLFTDEVNIIGISAVTKLSGVFTLTGIPMPYMDKIIESAAYLAETTTFTGMSEPYNISLAMRFMVQSAGEVGIDDETQALLDAAAPRFVRSLSVKLKDFYKRDGGFGYNVGVASTHSQGAHVMPDIDASDVNATQLAKGCRNDLYWLMGMETPPLYTSQEFLDRIRQKEPITEPLIKLGEDLDPAREVEFPMQNIWVKIVADGHGFVHGQQRQHGILELRYYPEAGYDIASYQINDEAPVTDIVKGKNSILIKLTESSDITVTFAPIESAETPELVSRATGEKDDMLKVEFRGNWHPTIGFTAAELAADEWIGANGSVTDSYTLSYRFKIAEHIAGDIAAVRPIILFNGMTSFHIIGDKLYLVPNTESWDKGDRTYLCDFTYDTWHDMKMVVKQYYHRSSISVYLDGVLLGGGPLMDAADPSSYYWTCQRAAIPQTSISLIGKGADWPEQYQTSVPENGVFFGVTAWSGDTVDPNDAYYRGFDFYLDELNLEFDSTLSGVPEDIIEDFNHVMVRDGAVNFIENASLIFSKYSSPLGIYVEEESRKPVEDKILHIEPSCDGGAAGSGYMPMGGLYSTALAAEQIVDAFTFSIGFKFSNMVRGVYGRSNPIALANGTNVLTIIGDGLYLSSSTKQNETDPSRVDKFITELEEDVWYNVKLYVYKKDGKVLTDVIVNGVVYRGFEVTYVGVTEPTVQTKKMDNVSNFHMPDSGLYFGVSWYGARYNTVASGTDIPMNYCDFDLDIDYIGLDFAGVPEEVRNIEFTNITSVATGVGNQTNLVFPEESTLGWAFYRECLPSILEDGEERAAVAVAEMLEDGLFVIGKVNAGTADEFGLILSPTRILGTLTKEKLANYYVTNTGGNSETYAFSSFAHGADGQFGVKVLGEGSNYFNAFGKIYAYVYALNEHSDVVTYLPVVFE